MKRVIIFGGRGFVGSEIVKQLKGFDVYTADRGKTNGKNISVDISDKKSIEKLITLKQFQDFSKDMSMKEYEQYKTNFMNMVEKDKVEDYTFPDFEDFYKQRTLATIKGDTYSPSDLKVSFDNQNIEKMNRILRMK